MDLSYSVITLLEKWSFFQSWDFISSIHIDCHFECYKLGCNSGSFIFCNHFGSLILLSKFDSTRDFVSSFILVLNFISKLLNWAYVGIQDSESLIFCNPGLVITLIGKCFPYWQLQDFRFDLAIFGPTFFWNHYF